MRGLTAVSAGAVVLVASGCGIHAPWTSPEPSGPCHHEVLGAAEGMASVMVGFDDATVPFGKGTDLRVCPYGFTGLPLVLDLPPGVTATPDRAEVGADGEPITFRVVATEGATGPITWTIGSRAEGLQATGTGATVVTTDEAWHLELPEH